MILTGKAKSDFDKWIRNEGLHEEVIYESVINFLIIEWLDSVGIYVEVGYLHAYKEWHRDVSTKTGSCYIRGWETRQQATKAAIEKANELYNKNAV